MDNKDNDLKKALDDIFGDDEIEIKMAQKSEDKTYNKNNEIKKYIDKDPFNEPEKKNDNVYVNSPKNDYPLINQSIEQDNHDNVLEKEIDANLDKLTTYNNKKHKKKNKEKRRKKVTDKKQINISKKRIIILFLFVILILGFGTFLIVNYNSSKEKVTTCYESATDDGYEYTDEYKITYVNNSITYVYSSYSYTALADEYLDQIDYVKENKLSVIINSNGMDGFTYVYEVSEDTFKVNGYLDFTLINFDEVDEINQDLMPLSYFKFDSSTTYEDLISTFEAQGYECTPSS